MFLFEGIESFLQSFGFKNLKTFLVVRIHIFSSDFINTQMYRYRYKQLVNNKMTSAYQKFMSNSFSVVSAFGLGTLVFNGLEMAMHSLMEGSCLNGVVFVHPVLHGLFTFLQMHFLFVNSQASGKLLMTSCFPPFDVIHPLIRCYPFSSGALFFKKKAP